MRLAEYFLLAATSLSVIVDPIATIPAFFAITPNDSTESRIRMARLACLVGAGVLMTFVLVGPLLFRLMGITLSAFKIAGGILLLLIALDMLRAKRSPVQETTEENDAAAHKDDVAITPLAVPMLAGPGAISTAILLQSQAAHWTQTVALLLSIAGVFFASYHVFRFAAIHGVKWISPIAMKITTRIMGLLLAAVAVQFALDGLAEQRERIFGH